MFIAFRLKPGRDDDLINWLNTCGDGDRSYYIREALRHGLVRQGLDQLLPAVKIQAKQVQSAKQEVDEADLMKALDAWDS